MAQSRRPSEEGSGYDTTKIGDFELKQNDPALLKNPKGDTRRQGQIIEAIVKALRARNESKKEGLPKGYYGTFRDVMRANLNKVSDMVAAYLRGDGDEFTRIGKQFNDMVLYDLEGGAAPAVIKGQTRSALARLPEQGKEPIRIQHSAARERFGDGGDITARPKGGY